MLLAAHTIVKKLQSHGFKAYFAGGAVRDMLLEKKFGDIDIATSATPDEIEALFVRTYPIGKQFGVILVTEGQHHFEVATFRSDSGTSDGRRPEYIIYTSPEEDARRRDFTINGMFYDPTTDEVLDYVGGKSDLAEKVIRFIGDPQARIEEDHLRLLRAVRFAHQICGQYEPQTYAAIKKNAGLIATVSGERIREELTKMLLLPTRSACFEDLQDLGLLPMILPEVAELKGVAQPSLYHKEGSVWIHAMRSIDSLKGKDATDVSLLWAVLLHDCGKPATFHVEGHIRFDGHAKLSAEMSGDALERLKFPRAEKEKICWAIEHHMSLQALIDKNTSLLRKIHWVTHPWYYFLLRLHLADARGALPRTQGMYPELMQERKIIKQTIPKRLPKLISGEEVMSLLHLDRGPRVGEALSKIREWQLLGEVKTKKEVIEKLLKIP